MLLLLIVGGVNIAIFFTVAYGVLWTASHVWDWLTGSHQ